MYKAYCRTFIGMTKDRERDKTSLGKQREMEINGKSVNRSSAPCTSPLQSSPYSHQVISLTMFCVGMLSILTAYM